MSTPIGRTVTRLLSIVALVLFVAFSAGSANAEPNANANDTASERAAANSEGRSDPGRSGSDSDNSQPQPPSNADFSGHGANTHGPYDSTRDGSPSGNGNGDGQAVGKPCAGCVGKADNKNPPGQMPDGSDPNAGYECDRNSGIGKTNPAHTGCKPTPPTTSTPPPTTPPGQPPGQPPGEKPPGEKPPGGQPPAGLPPAGGEQPPAAGEQPPGEVSGESLPVTGVNLGSLLTIGLALLAAGGLLLGIRRAAHRRAS